MSLYVVERENEWGNMCAYLDRLALEMTGRVYLSAQPLTVPDIRDCNEHDGEWPAFISLPHEHVEWDGRDVPLFEGDVERREWEARNATRRQR
jgi:hypothetical protein